MQASNVVADTFAQQKGVANARPRSRPSVRPFHIISHVLDRALAVGGEDASMPDHLSGLFSNQGCAGHIPRRSWSCHRPGR